MRVLLRCKDLPSKLAKRRTYSDTFSIVGPMAWNSLPNEFSLGLH